LTWSAVDWQTLNSITGKGSTDMAKKTKIEVEESTGNVFADLGLPNPEQELLKAGLTLEIYRILTARSSGHSPGGEAWSSLVAASQSVTPQAITNHKSQNHK
jgi:hypothetical protein